jgi:hypothetical protein
MYVDAPVKKIVFKIGYKLGTIFVVRMIQPNLALWSRRPVVGSACRRTRKEVAWWSFLDSFQDLGGDHQKSLKKVTKSLMRMSVVFATLVKDNCCGVLFVIFVPKGLHIIKFTKLLRVKH